MRRKHFLFGASLFSTFFYTQNVGINTDTPQTKLHINGNLQLTNELVVSTSKQVKAPGNIGDILVSQGAGKAPQWKKIEETFIPLEAGFMRSSSPTNVAANTPTNVIFNEKVLELPKYATISPDKSYFIIQKAGFYLVTSYLGYKLTMDSTKGSAAAITYIFKNNDSIASTLGNFTNITPEVFHSLSIAHYFEVGDKIHLKGEFIRDCTFNESFLSIQYFGS